MTRTGVYVLTAISAVLFVLLSTIFADGLFTENWWDTDDLTNSPIWTYVLLALIIGAGILHAQRLPPEGVSLRTGAAAAETPGQVDDPTFWKLLLGNVHLALIWLPLRFFIGREWLSAGEHKIRDSAWMDGGPALQGYWQRAVDIPEEGRPQITYGWFRDFLQYMLDREWYTWFAPLIAWGEFLVGIALLVGALVGIAAFFGTFMNFNFLLAGTASTNPVLFGLGVFVVLAWKVAGFWGVDRWLLPLLGTPWNPGRALGDDSDRRGAGTV